jgi:glycosyltransferase involved in cell wall biosynthesis
VRKTVFLLQSASISVGAARAPFREFLREFFREFSRKPSRNTPTCRPYTGGLKNWHCSCRVYCTTIFFGNFFGCKNMDASHKKPQLTIVWEGPQMVHSSLALINREHCSNIIDSGVANVAIVPAGNDRISPEGNPKLEKLWAHDVRQMALPAPNLPYVWIRHQWPTKTDAPRGAKWVINQPWEFSQLTKKMAKAFNEADEIWTPTTFCRDAFIRSGVPEGKIQIVPNGIDPGVFTPNGLVPELPTKKKFRFLFVGGTIFRKGIDVLLQAYVKAFTAKDDVCLIIKEIGGETFYKGQTAEEIINTIRQNPDSPEILYTKSMISDMQMAELYRACDVFISPYRGEGFSLPTLEAMACGLPVMVTAGGATDDFVDETVGWRIPAGTLALGSEIDGEELTGPATMLEPDSASLVELMMDTVQKPHEVREKGIRAAQRARTDWTWNRATMKVLSRLDALYNTTMSIEAQSTLKDQPDLMVLFTTAEELYAQGSIDDAIACYHACFASNALPLRYQLLGLHRMASICLYNEEIELCEQYLSKARNYHASHPDTYYIQSVLHAMRGEWDEALESLTFVLDGWKSYKFQTMLGVSLETLLCDSARALFATGALNEARELYTKILEMNPHNPEACYGAAQCFQGIGAVVEAKTMFDWAVRLQPSYEDARQEFEAYAA